MVLSIPINEIKIQQIWYEKINKYIIKIIYKYIYTFWGFEIKESNNWLFKQVNFKK